MLIWLVPVCILLTHSRWNDFSVTRKPLNVEPESLAVLNTVEHYPVSAISLSTVRLKAADKTNAVQLLNRPPHHALALYSYCNLLFVSQ